MAARIRSIVLLVFAISGLSFGQKENLEWKKYTFPTDGFSLIAPELPKAHDSVVLRGATSYTIPLEGSDTLGVVLKVTKKAGDCAEAISQLKERVRGRRDPSAEIVSAKDISLDGRPGFEYVWKKSDAYSILERWFCVDGRLYIFSVSSSSARPFPVEASRVLDSFRILSTGSHP